MATKELKTSHAQLRKVPKQERSLARFNHILDEAEKIVEEHGCEGLGMNELARQAEVNIASIYQYFPHRAAIIRQLIERYLQQFSTHLGSILSQSQSLTMTDLINQIIDDYYALFLKYPVFAAIWCDSQGDPVLKSLDISDSRRNTEQIIAFLPDALLEQVGKNKVETLVFLICDQVGSLMQTALMLDLEEGQRLVDTYKEILAVYIQQNNLGS